MKRFIKLGFSSMSNSMFAAMVARILSMLTGNPAFTTPSPTLIFMNSLLTAFNNALTAYGVTPGSRGTSTQKQTLDAARVDLENALVLLSNYCENQANFDGVILASAGWDLRSTPNPVGIIGPVRDLATLSNDEVGFGEVSLDWNRPFGVSASNVNAYNVYRSASSNFSSATFIKSVPRTNFKDTGLTNPFYYYWVIPIGTAGDGAISDVCMAAVKMQP